MAVAKPVADFTANVRHPAAGYEINFTSSALTTNTPISWAWTFGDGSTSTEQDPDHTYAAEGVYTVKLVATNGSGSGSIRKINYIVVGPVAAVQLTLPVRQRATLTLTTPGASYA